MTNNSEEAALLGVGDTEGVVQIKIKLHLSDFYINKPHSFL